jgi:DNA repair exonuclease SbcCD ATPase subunit
MKTTIEQVVKFYELYPQFRGNILVRTRFGYKKIEDAQCTAKNSNVIGVFTESGEFVKGSPDHLMLSNDARWVAIKDLVVGNWLFNDNGPTKITKITRYSATTDLYDLQVSEVKEFFANGLVSHNSTMLDAICFALFNKPFRNISKTQIINSINKKQCMVELEFDIGSKAYKIRRGIKPNVFEIFIDGTLVDQDAASRDYQAYLEEHILKINYKAFTQIVILGSASFVPFMQLPASSRREIIEDILDIRIFSVMNTVLKERLVDMKARLQKMESDLTLAKQQTKNQDTFIKVLETDHQTKIDENREAIRNAREEIVVAEKLALDYEESQERVRISLGDVTAPRLALQNVERSNAEYGRQIAALKKEIEQYEKNPTALAEAVSIRLELQTIERNGSDITKEIMHLQEEIEQYQNNPTCPTCGSKMAVSVVRQETISREKKIDTLAAERVGVDLKQTTLHLKLKALAEQAIQTRRNQILELEESLNNNTTALIAAQEAMETIKLGEDQMKVVEKKAAEQRNIISSQERFIASLEKQIMDAEAKTGNIDKERETLAEMASNVVQLMEDRAILNEEKHYLDIAATMLKDSGIKTKVIRQYLDTINKLVNKYLAAMDFFVSFTLDEEFKEVIKSEFRDEFSYENFSEGEKQKIDLSLMFTWRTIAKTKNSMNTNLLILDEVFDSSLDVDGTDFVMNLLNELAGTNVWVISHKGQGIDDKFTKVIKFEKKQNFSYMESE